MVNTEAFAKRLELLMEYYEISATALADKITFNRSTISHLISGRNKPSLEFVLKILENFPEVSLDWLTKGKGNFPQNERLEKFLPPPLDEKKPISSSSSKKEKSFIPNIDVPKAQHSEVEIERIVIFFKDGSFRNYKG